MLKHIVRGNPYFPSTTSLNETYPALKDNIHTKVAIVGGGITGALTAYFFTSIGVPVVVLEKSSLCSSSTCITTTLLQYELDELLYDFSKDDNLATAIEGYSFGALALASLNNIINKNSIYCDYIQRDSLLYTNDPKKSNSLSFEYEVRKDAGFDVSLINSTTSGYDFSFDIASGVYAHKGGAELNPMKLAYALFKYAKEHGAKIYENTYIKSFEDNGDSIKLFTDDGYTITADKAVVATGYDISAFTGEKYITKYTTYNLVTSPIEDIKGWNNKCLIKSCEDPYTYLRTTPDNRIIIGGCDTRFIPEFLEESVSVRQYKKLEERLHEMFPDLNFRIDYKYNGMFGTTKDNLPYIGADKNHKNLYYNLGYGANGILFAVNGAEMLSKLYKGEHPSYMSLVDINR